MLASFDGLRYSRGMADEGPDVIDPVEDCPWRSPREILARYGYSPLAPADLDDRQLAGRLWELAYAAAAQRFYFSRSNHLSDRELYTVLWEQWLDQPTADLPLDAETNTRVIVAEYDALGMTAEDIFLKYYADESDLELWRSAEPNIIFPPHVDPPCDRDRFFPVPPIPCGTHAGWVPDEDLGLASVDAEIAADDTESAMDEMEAIDPALEADLEACEPENWTPPAAQLAAENVPVLPPAEITDETLTPILWELLHNLAQRSFYLLHTDHLSDGELYAELWQHGLREPACLSPPDRLSACFHDILGSWGEDQIQLWLRYYASDDERSQHAAEWPNDTLPPKRKLPFNRDWRLPKAPF